MGGKGARRNRPIYVMSCLSKGVCDCERAPACTSMQGYGSSRTGTQRCTHHPVDNNMISARHSDVEIRGNHLVQKLPDQAETAAPILKQTERTTRLPRRL